MKLTFYGGAGAVTGANYLLEFDDPSHKNGKQKILIDCGLSQGGNEAERGNFKPFPYKASEIDRVLITHAHIDHSGLLPKLIKAGFKGNIFSTAPTRDFAEPLLLDAEHIMRNDAEKYKSTPIYSIEDVTNMLKQWHAVDYEKLLPLGGGGASAMFYSAGHILGSASILIHAEGKNILFSGDLGNAPAPLIGPPEPPADVDYCLIESAYGDRIHEDLAQRRKKLEEVAINSIQTGGTLMIPTFALSRTQILLLELKHLFEKHEVKPVPVFLDSPLAIKITEIYNKYRGYFRPEVASRFAHPESIFDFPNLRITPTTEESKSINKVKGPKIIIAGSGMSTAGRILHHEKRYLPDANSTLLIFGYQVAGTLGRMLLDGKKRVKIMGEQVNVKARVRAIGAYSAHADQNQLIEWVKPFKDKVKKIFVVQGDPKSSGALADRIKKEYKIDAVVPKNRGSVTL
ncbi:MAG: MBL fold hydrolase [Candidatus Harrisonbacteria bacterium CG10_big_fil_rev_8_21_14_0_10_44_23]|uniref:MBL fold hydrolase n=1 Tax=Candidatus Harrisonbacteria bacterium CG10_big_fil_rev_8_21_14_0_10_44_23 TaxID=1974585 RepID=A0A2H0UQB6_9BACT|nr:MAG: MBL fold hydrolase [Candidatus Harrisonbacteria bacterium CG10_big_fil_rev_8_21_14_0_10_44_23]